LYRVGMPTPEQREPDVCIKEIQCVHRCVRWLDLPLVPLTQ
jgi:hypothetical protein